MRGNRDRSLLSGQDTMDSTVMIRMAVAHHNVVQLTWIFAQSFKVVLYDRSRKPNIEQGLIVVTPSRCLYEQAQAILGLWWNTFRIEVVDESGTTYATGTAVMIVHVAQQHIHPVVNQYHDLDMIRFKHCLANRPFRAASVAYPPIAMRPWDPPAHEQRLAHLGIAAPCTHR